jgi:hypothetical protein
MKIIEITKNIFSLWKNIYRPIRILIGALCFILFIIITRKCQTDMFKREFALFYSSEINGKIAQIKMGKGESFFNTDKRDPYFRFVDLSSLGTSGRFDFGNFARPGDSVYKAAYGDTVYLFQKGIVYKYTFVHIEQ